VLNRNNKSIVLLPLAGSSTIRQTGIQFEREVKHSDEVYFITRDYASRLLSFYNKKVLNPDELGKCLLLSRSHPLNHETPIEDFITYAYAKLDSLDKDKHLFTEENIIKYYQLDSQHVHLLDIVDDLPCIEKLLGTELSDKRVNSTISKARFAKPIKLEARHRSTINSWLSVNPKNHSDSR